MLDPFVQWTIEAFQSGAGMTEEEAEEMRLQYRSPKCTQCGKCCRAVPCIPCSLLFGQQTKICPLLTDDNKCMLIESLFQTKYRDTIREVLSVGCGCSWNEVFGREKEDG